MERKSRLFGACTIVLALAIGLQTALAPPVSADEDALETAGDVLQVAIPLSAFASTLFVGDGQGNRWDREGSKQMLYSYGSAWVTMMVVKQGAAKLRPNGTSRTSYPSGHTTSAFGGAAFLQKRYGGI